MRTNRINWEISVKKWQKRQKKWFKKSLNRKIRHTKLEGLDNCGYKKVSEFQLDYP